ncbi:YcxB family protein [Micromonospora globbae]|uniref:YcxB family protein n=2 Tax=Micromonospora globbae TaxID=1894969 RepID=A0A420F2B7_9ACTN|nr:YcxB family protein [Micromonospora globbae]
MISFETQPDRRLLEDAMRRAFRQNLMLLRLSGVLLMVLAVLVVLVELPVIAAGLVAGGVVLVLSPRWIVRNAVQLSWKTYGIPIAWQFADEGVRMASALTEGLVRWPALESVEPIPGQLLFKINRQQVIPVPIAGLDPSDRTTLTDFLRDRGLLRAGAAVRS